MQSRESESDSIWLCLEKVAQPGQPTKLFTTNNTDPDEHYLWTQHGATAHRMWGHGMGRLGDLEAGMPCILPMASGNVQALGLLCDFL